jgi:uncharacterized protein YkwD
MLMHRHYTAFSFPTFPLIAFPPTVTMPLERIVSIFEPKNVCQQMTISQRDTSMKSTVRRRSLSSRAFIFLILLGVCLISVLTYTATFAHGWNGWGNHGFPWWAAGHGQNCGSGVTQVCNPYGNAWQTCTSTTDQSTPAVGQDTTTPTNNGQRWQRWHDCGQNGATPPAGVVPCTSPTAQFMGPQTPPSVASTQTPAPTTTPCNTPISTVPVPTVFATPTTSLQPTPPTPPPSVPTPVSTPVSGNDPQSQAAQAVFAQINQERASQGLPAMQWSDQLQQSAHNHNLAMAQANQLEHQLPGEPDFGTRITNAGLHWSSAAENIAPVYYATDAATIQSNALQADHCMFMEPNPCQGYDTTHETGHHDNILSGNTLVGVDVLIDTRHNTIWLTEDFAKPM